MIKFPFKTFPVRSPRRNVSKLFKFTPRYRSLSPIFEEEIDEKGEIKEEIEERERFSPSISLVSLELPDYHRPLQSSESTHLIFLKQKTAKINEQVCLTSRNVEKSVSPVSENFFFYLLSNPFSGSLAIISWALLVTGIIMLTVAVTCPPIFGLAVSISGTTLGLGIVLQTGLYFLGREKSLFQPIQQTKQLSILDIKRVNSIADEPNSSSISIAI